MTNFQLFYHLEYGDVIDIYSCDTFNENSLPTSDPTYISSLGSAVYKAMSKAEKDALWLMQAKHWDTFYKFYRNTIDNEWGGAYPTRDFFHNMASKLGYFLLQKKGMNLLLEPLILLEEIHYMDAYGVASIKHATQVYILKPAIISFSLFASALLNILLLSSL